MADFAHAGDWHDEIPPAQYPSQRQLCRRDLLFLRDLHDAIHLPVVGFQIARLETRQRLAEIVFCKVRLRAHRAGQHAAPERAIGDETNTEFATDRQNTIFRIASP